VIVSKTKRLYEITAACFTLPMTLRSYRCNEVIPKRTTFCTTGTPILHVEAPFISAERGLRRGISSRTSLKCHIHFSFILKLIIFIYKQLKRPVAFSAVHFDIKPHVVTLQNNFLLLHLNHEDLGDQRFWHCQEACASIGTRNDDSDQERRSCSSRPPQQSH